MQWCRINSRYRINVLDSQGGKLKTPEAFLQDLHDSVIQKFCEQLHLCYLVFGLLPPIKQIDNWISARNKQFKFPNREIYQKFIPCIGHKLELAEHPPLQWGQFYLEYTCHRKYPHSSCSDAEMKRNLIRILNWKRDKYLNLSKSYS